MEQHPLSDETVRGILEAGRYGLFNDRRMRPRWEERTHYPEGELPPAAFWSQRPLANDNNRKYLEAVKTRLIATVDVRPPGGFLRGALAPACMISSLVAMAGRYILIYSQSLRKSTYEQEHVIDAFTQAIARGVKVWIVLSSRKSRSWAEAHRLLGALASEIGKTVFIACRDGGEEEGAAAIDVNEANFILVDDRYIRFEEQHNGSSAYAVNNPSAGASLFEAFRHLWSVSAQLGSSVPAAIEVEERSYQLDTGGRQLNAWYLQAKNFKAAIAKFYRPEQRSKAAEQLAEAVSYQVGLLADDETIRYQSRICGDRLYLALTMGEHVRMAPPKDLFEGVRDGEELQA